MKKTYCNTIGIEYMYISSTEEKRWIQRKFEGSLSTPSLTLDQKRWVLERLTAAETLERYLHTRYVGQKRFSGEGGETMIPMLDTVIENAGAHGREGSRDRHGAPRAPERAREQPRQDPRGALRRIRRQARATSLPRAT